MPRITANKYQYMEKDAANFINGKTRGCGKEDKDVAAAIGIGPSSYCNRRRDGKFNMSYIDLVKTIELLELSDEDIIVLMRGKFQQKRMEAI
ncbi:MAG: hypothetical protein ACI4TK_18810 [Agathobacter sp.]